MACFREESDYLVYLSMLRQAATKAACAVHAYCLMRNHVHLLLTPASAASCAALMHDLAQPYARYFNKKHQRTGTLWEGRFRSCVVESSSYVIACYRYIELNPVRAGIVTHPSLYPWSSYAANASGMKDALIQLHSELQAIGRHAYAGLIMETVGAEMIDRIREATNGGYPLATDMFRSGLSAPGRRVVPGKPGRPAKAVGEDQEKSVPGTDLFSEGGVS